MSAQSASILPVQAKKQVSLKQRIKGQKNLPRFEPI